MREADLGNFDPRLTDAVLKASEPTLLKGLAGGWPSVARAGASDEEIMRYLAQFDSGNPVTALRVAPDAGGRIFYTDDLSGFNFDRVRLSIQTALQEIAAEKTGSQPSTLYVGSTNVDHWMPGFRADNDLALEHLNPLVSIWFGRRTTVAAHFDFPSNLMVAVSGHRTVTLFPPDQIDNLYVGPVEFTPAGQPISLVDFAAPDFSRFPRFSAALAAATTIELAPGDALVVPSMWWHHVEATGSFNVLVNYWWRDSPAYLGAPLNVLLHALLGLKDLPHHERAHWRGLLDHYVFDASLARFAHIPEEARGILAALDESQAQNLRALLRERLKS